MTPRKHYAILIRHCARSTEKKVILYNSTDELKYKAKDFIGSPLPKWNTPKKWCTQHAMEIIEATASYILDKLTLEAENLKNIQIQIITDSAQRDVDTSLALRNGMLQAAAKMDESGILFGGLQSLEYDHFLFKVFDGFCEANYTSERLASDIQNRFSTITPPEPNLNETLLLLEKLGGIGKVEKLTDMDQSLRLSSFSNYTQFEGATNIVKLFSQMVIYSRASEVDPPFLPDMSTSDLYRLFAWIHWSRSVLHVGNVRSAISGTVIAKAILEALEYGSYHVPGSVAAPCNEDADACVTILVGHDGDIDSFATAFDLHWLLRPPYRSGKAGEYYPSPPGSGIYIEYDLQSKVSKLSYLFPNFFPGEVPLIDCVPLVFNSPIRQELNSFFDLTKNNQTTSIIPLRQGISSLEVLRDRLNILLRKYPEANDCYDKAVNRSHHSGQSILKSKSKLKYNSTVGLNVSSLALVLLIVGILFSVFCYLKRRRHRKRERGSVYKYSECQQSTIEIT